MAAEAEMLRFGSFFDWMDMQAAPSLMDRKMDAGSADMSRRPANARRNERRARTGRLSLRVDDRTNALAERAAALERRKLTDFCPTALTDPAERTIARHRTLALSERDRQMFFDMPVNPPTPSPRLRRAFKAERRRIAP